MAWNLINVGTSVLGRQALNCRVGPGSYFSLVVLSAGFAEQKFFGVLSKEFLNTPDTGLYSQLEVIKVWTRSVVQRNPDQFNDVDLFVFWRFPNIDWEIWRFD